MEIADGTKLLEWAVTTGGPVMGLAVVMFMFYRKDMKAMQEETRKQADLWQQQCRANDAHMEIMIEVIKENSQVVAKHTELVNAMSNLIRDQITRERRR